MKAILKKYNIVEKLLLLCLLIMVSKPIVCQLLFKNSITYLDHRKSSSNLVFTSAEIGDLDNTEYIEEVEELLEDDEVVHPYHNEKQPFYLPISKIVDEIIIYCYQCSFYKTFTKPRYYITYSCLKSHLA